MSEQNILEQNASEQSEQSKFLKELDTKEDNNVLDAPLTEEAPEKEESEEDMELKAKNRRERRLLEKYQRTKEEAIAYAARLQAIQEAQQIRGTTEESEYIERIKRIYGDATPEAKEATNLLIEAFRGVEESAIKKAIEKLEAEKEAEAQQIKEEERTLDEISDKWEDDYGIDMSDESVRKGIFTLLEKLSPKDGEGNIKEYADVDSVAEIYLANKEKSSSRAKELSSRSMSRGGSKESKISQDALERTLRENGII
jgi:hypothetical protein